MLTIVSVVKLRHYSLFALASLLFSRLFSLFWQCSNKNINFWHKISWYIENIMIYKRYRNISKNSIFFSTIRYDISISKMIYRYFRYIKSSLVQAIPPIATHFSMCGPSHSHSLLKTFNRLICHLARTLVASSHLILLHGVPDPREKSDFKVKPQPKHAVAIDLRNMI